jgi:hypothetical protein
MIFASMTSRLAHRFICSNRPNATIARECFDSATFNIAVNGTPPYDVTWYSNGVVVATVSNAVAKSYSYTTPPLNRSAQGAVYHAAVRNECGLTRSDDAVVSVVLNAPVLLSAVSPGPVSSRSTPRSFSVSANRSTRPPPMNPRTMW